MKTPNKSITKKFEESSPIKSDLSYENKSRKLENKFNFTDMEDVVIRHFFSDLFGKEIENTPEILVREIFR